MNILDISIVVKQKLTDKLHLMSIVYQSIMREDEVEQLIWEVVKEASLAEFYEEQCDSRRSNDESIVHDKE